MVESTNELKENHEEPIPVSLLVSAAYERDKNLVVLKFYDPIKQELRLWEDKTGHKPYCYSKLSKDEIEGTLGDRNDVVDIQSEEKNDLLNDCKIKVSKILGANPLVIGGTDHSIRNKISTWESDIKYHSTYLYDNKLIIGKYYKVENNKVIPENLEISDDVNLSLKNLLWDKSVENTTINSKEFQEYLSEWADLLNQPIPKIKRISFDIEVEAEIGRIPDPKIADRIVTAIGFEGSDEFKQVYVLKKNNIGLGKNELPEEVTVRFFDDEKEMILEAFEKILDYPFVLTYNGDEFDMPYLFYRAQKLKIEPKKNPFYMMRDSASLKKGVHIDLYRVLSNRSFQIYAFSHKYTNFSLNSVSKALLNEEKIDYGIELDKLNLYQTANYCFNDARLTYKLTSFNNDLLMNLLVVISRIGRMPIDEIARVGVSQWIRSLLYYEHRKRNALIPRSEDLENKSVAVTSNAIIKEKKYRGGLVVEPTEGIHFNVTVMDFASLYPSIIKVKNISYETVRCPHEECKKNTIPQTNHWACTRNNGITSLLIGSLRDLRVNYYKHLSKSESFSEEQKQQYTVTSQALKVILNASYGVMGAEIFPLYFLPSAEATTAIGRDTILQTITRCKKSGIEVLYGDTDSLFIKNPTQEQIQTVIEWAKKEHGVELEIDKEYRYVVLSGRKKNYLGVTKTGKVDVKGLTGKKSHTPPFIKTLFYELLEFLSDVQTKEDFIKAKKQISDKILEWAKKIENKEIPLKNLAFNVMLSKAPTEYNKMIPQHIRAAKLLESIREVKKGEIISYVKEIAKPGVKPIEMAKPEEIDSKKYMEFMESTLDQITSSMDLDFDTILGKQKQTGLEQFIGEIYDK